MDALTINVKVSLEETTIQKVAQIFTTCIGGARPAVPSAPAPVEVRSAEPQKPAAPQQPSIDNMTLNKAVKDAQARGVDAPVIRAVFARYGIASSRECAPERRADLLAELQDLKPDMPA